MNKLVSNVCAFIYFQVTQLMYDCTKIQFPPYFFFLLVDSSRCEKNGYNCISSCTEFWEVTVQCAIVFQQTHKSSGEVDQEVVSTFLCPILVIIKFGNLRK
jgi:hypothetical protein